MENLKLPLVEEENSDEENCAFYINKNGFPIDDKTWNRMFRYASKIYPDAKKDMEKIKNGSDLADIPLPAAPVFTPQMSTTHCLRLVQDYINSLSYNHTGTQLFEIRKGRPLAGLMDKAKEMIREGLPIKCLEAVILALYLTNCLASVQRFPIGFKSVFNGHRYYHVVLGIYYGGYFGALGMSRRNDLMDKPLKYGTLYALISDFDIAYSNYTHELKKVRIGSCVPHDICSQEKIEWGMLSVNFAKTKPIHRQRKLDQYSKNIRSHFLYPIPVFTKRDSSRAANFSSRENSVAVKPSPNDAYAVKSARRCHKTTKNDASFHVKV